MAADGSLLAWNVLSSDLSHSTISGEELKTCGEKRSVCRGECENATNPEKHVWGKQNADHHTLHGRCLLWGIFVSNTWKVIRASEQGTRTVKMMPAGCVPVRQETYYPPSSPWTISSSGCFEALHLPSVAPVRLEHTCHLRGALQLTPAVETSLHFSILTHTGNGCKCVKMNQERT